MGNISVGTIHLAKGLEFGAAAVMAYDDEVIPFPAKGVEGILTRFY